MDQPSTTQFVDLPQHILMLLFSKLESIDALRLGCTCRHLAMQLLNEQLWHHACAERWFQVAPFATSAASAWQWKDIFFRRNGWATDVQMQVSIAQQMDLLCAVTMSHNECGAPHDMPGHNDSCCMLEV